jgi:hypothetical protein
MKKSFFQIFLLASLMLACSPSQQITGYWANKEAISKEPYKTIYVMAITKDENRQPLIENKMADVLVARGRKVMLNSQIYPPSFSAVKQLTKEQLAETIKNAGCDAVLTLAVLDTKTETSYTPGSTYYPMNYGYYGSYYGYYSHYYPVVYSPGYYSENKTYYIETNFYDVKTDKLLWSIQSQAYNPTNIDMMFSQYSELILDKLRKEGLINK